MTGESLFLWVEEPAHAEPTFHCSDSGAPNNLMLPSAYPHRGHGSDASVVAFCDFKYFESDERMYFVSVSSYYFFFICDEILLTEDICGFIDPVAFARNHIEQKAHANFPWTWNDNFGFLCCPSVVHRVGVES